MGASEWVYYAPYQEDIEQAFQAVRQQVFERQEYFHWGEVLEYERAKEALCAEHGVDLWDHEAVEQLLQEVGPIQISKARTIEEYFQKPDDGQGTHSILDIPRFCSSYEGICISEDLIKQLFEDQRPTQEVVEAVVLQEAIWSGIRSWIEINLHHRARNPGGWLQFVFSEEVLQFLTRQRSPQELVDALIAHEEMWRAIYPCVCSQVEWCVRGSKQGKMLPFPTQELLRFFGTEQPTRRVVEEALEEMGVWSLLLRGMGYYAVIYQDDLPDEIVFIGCSGD